MRRSSEARWRAQVRNVIILRSVSLFYIVYVLLMSVGILFVTTYMNDFGLGSRVYLDLLFSLSFAFSTRTSFLLIKL